MYLTSAAVRLSNTLDLIQDGYGGPKDEFHRAAVKLLKAYARDVLGLSDSQFDVRSNKGGDGVVGEVTLHTDSLYVQIHKPMCGDNEAVLFRSCNGRSDYCGGRNRYCTIKYMVENNLRDKLAPFLVA